MYVAYTRYITWGSRSMVTHAGIMSIGYITVKSR